ncbi:MAG TPA: mechanosensitive ion channel family protein [bacterium]
MIEWLRQHGLRIAFILALGVCFYILLRGLIPRLVKRTVVLSMKDKPGVEAEKRIRTIGRVLNNTLGVIIILIVLFTIGAETGINIGPALASLGIIGIAVGFGAQSLIKDLINGFFILLENQYGVGDVVKIVDIAGQVEEINLRRTVLRDMDGIVHIVPNGTINVVSNFTKEFSRVNMNITVAYKEDIDAVIAVVNRVCTELAADPQWGAKIIKTPQVLRVDSLGASGVEIKIWGETLPILQWQVMGELRKRIKKEFDRKGIEIPYPHMKVHLENPPKD